VREHFFLDMSTLRPLPQAQKPEEGNDEGQCAYYGLSIGSTVPMLARHGPGCSKRTPIETELSIPIGQKAKTRNSDKIDPIVDGMGTRQESQTSF
jgi:hypothetical protein